MIFLSATLLAIALTYFWLTERHKRKLFANATLVSVTEEAEQIHFAVQLFDDETAGSHQEKMNSLFEMAEKRRAYNNERTNAKRENLMAQFDEQKDSYLPQKAESAKIEAL